MPADAQNLCIKHTGEGSVNANTGTGTQNNYSQSGSHNTQIISFGDSGQSVAERCRRALFLCDPAVDRSNLISSKGERVPGTCEWVKGTPEFKAWLSGHDGPLCIRGGPGKGKTMISIFLTKDFEKISEQVVFYFCNHTVKERSTATAILRGLIWQITGRISRLALHLGRYLDPQRSSPRNDPTLASQETLWHIFMDMIQDPTLSELVYCLVDGLDECDDDSRRWFLQKIPSIPAPSLLRLVIVSRHMQDLRSCTSIRLDPDSDSEIGEDIRTVVNAKVKELSIRIPNFEEIWSHVQTQLLLRAQGTFLWVGFAMTELLKCKSTSHVVRTINELPPGLGPLYARMLRRIEEADRPMSACILRWVTLAGRNLSLDEIGAIISPLKSRLITRRRAIEDAVSHCEPIIYLEKEGRQSHLRLVHMSARDYLLRRHPDDDPVLEDFRVKEKEAHLEMAEKCLDKTLEAGPLQYYARSYWDDHARGASTLAESMFDRKPQFFGEKCPARDACWEKLYSPPHFHGQPPLHLACDFNLPVWAHKILADNWFKFDPRKLYTQTHNHETALFRAMKANMLDIADTLLMQGADVDSRNGEGATAFLRTFRDSHLNLQAGLEQLEFLLDRGASVDAQDDSGVTALFVALRHANEPAVNLLLDWGADVDIRDNDGSNALDVAVVTGHEGIVERLLDRGCASGSGASPPNWSTATFEEKEDWIRKLNVQQARRFYGKDMKRSMALYNMIQKRIMWLNETGTMKGTRGL